ncbi:MAG TPA: F0F1 ATP synthase subunit epsilon [Nocardioides sp.]|uniref:F0F1 ATP synthase subunit epsilon n=1 Tax=uncultured Nocardioides sp. TaxID=198441 RepID=UPI0026024E59|nr:F0F1 ATP synthase subunit epsilon [uncultured Nocardioides sp.]HRD61301.1 F0F1 ATP synthase subunit epsilon [Nocardioides sp.]HRI95900.1 F0F1 ATP synthase subunit epsilon [Nocardioides sp.]HRK45714.1 F0F1 ATP synthase subunit epsilon [Nocardioides sp.]
MADALTVELVAADRMVWSGEATMVKAKTVDGDIGVLRGHAPVLSVLSEAIVEITAEGGHTTFAVTDGGFLSVANDRVSILAERVELATEVDVDEARAELEAAKAGHLTEGSDQERAIRLAEARIRLVERDTSSS